MVDILKILDQLKQKGLDVVQVELLQNAYELQNRNLEQLKENNDALRESNDLLKEKIAKLEQENQGMEKKLKSLPASQPKKEISPVAQEILRHCIKEDVTEFNDEIMIAKLSGQYSRMQVEAAIGELEGKRQIFAQSVFGGYQRGTKYYLTQSGKELALTLDEKE